MTRTNPRTPGPLGLEQVVEVVRLMAQTFDLPLLLRSIEEAATRLLPCERARILEYDAGSEEFFGVLPLAGFRNMLPPEPPSSSDREFRISARTGTAGQAALTQRVILWPSASGDQEAMVVPVTTPEGELKGVLHILGRLGHRFSPDEQHFALILGSLAAIAVKRQSLLDAAEQKHDLERELRVAREVTELTLPPSAPSIAGFQVAASYSPAQWVGGDCYDFVPEDGGLAFLVADATGHGLDSALIVSRCRAYFRALVSLGLPLEEVAARINSLLIQELEGTDRFVSATLGRLKGGQLVYINAGQPPPILVRSPGAIQEAPPASSPPLGAFAEVTFEEIQWELRPDDLALFYTDGLLEWRSPSGQIYGEERLHQAVLQCRELAPQELLDRIRQDAARFSRGEPQRDDQTCLVIRRTEGAGEHRRSTR